MDLSDIIWSLITLAIVFGPGIISAVLKKSGEDAPKRPTAFPMGEVFPQFDEGTDEGDEDGGEAVGDAHSEHQVRVEAMEKPAPAPSAVVQPAPLGVSRIGIQSVAPDGLGQKTRTGVAGQQGRMKMEIDAKKLIIYSSIMNPKFRDN